MITDRFMQESDETILTQSLAQDEYHATTNVDFFKEQGTLTKVYELDGEPVLFSRACKALRLDLQFVNNHAARKNMQVMLGGFPALVEKARESGFREIIFNTSSPLLKKFCTTRLGFTEVEGDELRRAL